MVVREVLAVMMKVVGTGSKKAWWNGMLGILGNG